MRKYVKIYTNYYGKENTTFTVCETDKELTTLNDYCRKLHSEILFGLSGLDNIKDLPYALTPWDSPYTSFKNSDAIIKDRNKCRKAQKHLKDFVKPKLSISISPYPFS